jgi:hypothetical protein
MTKKISQMEILFLLIISALTMIAGVLVIARDEISEWQSYQSEFRQIVAENFGSVDPSMVPSGIQQIWVKDLDRVDRCIT